MEGSLFTFCSQCAKSDENYRKLWCTTMSGGVFFLVVVVVVVVLFFSFSVLFSSFHCFLYHLGVREKIVNQIK